MICSKCDGKKGSEEIDYPPGPDGDIKISEWVDCYHCEGTGFEPKFMVRLGNSSEEEALAQFSARARTKDAKFHHHPDIIAVNYADIDTLVSTAHLIWYLVSSLSDEFKEDNDQFVCSIESLDRIAQGFRNAAERQRPKDKVVRHGPGKPRTMDEAWGLTEIPARRDNQE